MPLLSLRHFCGSLPCRQLFLFLRDRCFFRTLAGQELKAPWGTGKAGTPSKCLRRPQIFALKLHNFVILAVNSAPSLTRLSLLPKLSFTSCLIVPSGGGVSAAGQSTSEFSGSQWLPIVTGKRQGMTRSARHPGRVSKCFCNRLDWVHNHAIPTCNEECCIWQLSA